MGSLESMRSNSNHQKNWRTGEFSMGHTPKRAWESNDVLRLSGGIQYLSYTSSPLIFDLNIQQVEKNVCLRRAVLLTISSHNTRLPTCDLRGELLSTGQGQHDHAIHLQLNTVFLVKPVNSSMPCWFWAIPQVGWLIAEKINLRTGAAGEMVLESMLLLAFPQEHGDPNKVFFCLQATC